MSLMFIIATLTTAIVSSSVAHKGTGAVFVQRPQNHTLLDSKKPFTLNCSVDIASEDGMDWVVQIKGVRERVCSSKDFYINASNSCLLNYSMDVPNNRTLNLIVDPRIATLGDKYCCQFDNGAGKKSCSFLTISHASAAVTDDPVGDITSDTEFADTATVVPEKNIAESKGSPDNSVVLIVVGIISGILAIVAATSVVYLILRKHRAKGAARSKGASGNEVTTPLKNQDGRENQSTSAV